MHLGYILIIFSQLLSSWTHNGGLNVDAVYWFLSVDLAHKKVENLASFVRVPCWETRKKREIRMIWMYLHQIITYLLAEVILGMNSPNSILDWIPVGYCLITFPVATGPLKHCTSILGMFHLHQLLHRTSPLWKQIKKRFFHFQKTKTPLKKLIHMRVALLIEPFWAIYYKSLALTWMLRPFWVPYSLTIHYLLRWRPGGKGLYKLPTIGTPNLHF